MSHASAVQNIASLSGQSLTRTLSQPEDPQSSLLTLICSVCQEGPFSYKGFRQAVSESHSDQTTGYFYATTWAEIFKSITNEACSWCRIIRRARDGLPAQNYPSPSEESVEVMFKISTKKSQGDIEIYLNGYKASTYAIYTNPGDSAAKEIGTKVTLKGRYVNYHKALKCITRCGSNHENCPAIEETYLPTRVIDCSDPSKPRLVETHRKIRGHYCALSYAWGGEQHQKTTTSNINTYVHQGINIPLPQTIADAIFVTNKLGIRYLWVDALCIIQDSSEDKDQELGIMAHIYRNAYVTISVLSAYRADQGFLPKERAVHLPFYLADTSEPLGRMLLEYNIPAPELRNHAQGSLVDSLAVPPLNRRGWCLQESLLSPRKLIFQPPHISYKCPSYNSLDISRGSQHNPYPADDRILFPPNRIHGGASPPTVNFSQEEFAERWQEILRDYSRRKITVPSDKLIAVASVAEVFQSISKDQYIAGLWRKTLIHDLLWTVAPPVELDEPVLLPRPTSYRAPTWSWASVDGGLYRLPAYPGRLVVTYEAEILLCEATPKINTLPFGEITDARLTMRVKMHPLMSDGRKCSFIERKGCISADGSGTRGYWAPPQGNCLEPSRFSVGGIDRRWPEELVEEVKFDCLEGTEQDRQMEFYVIILCGGKYRESEGQWLKGLLVIPVDGKAEHYRRVAKLDLQYLFKRLDWFDTMPLKTVTLV